VERRGHGLIQGTVDWIHGAQDRVHWLALVNMVMDPWVP
jgi:hypothetical protein